MSVGSQAQYVPTQKGNLFFGTDSTTLVDASSLGTAPVFTATSVKPLFLNGGYKERSRKTL